MTEGVAQNAKATKLESDQSLASGETPMRTTKLRRRSAVATGTLQSRGVPIVTRQAGDPTPCRKIGNSARKLNWIEKKNIFGALASLRPTVGCCLWAKTVQSNSSTEGCQRGRRLCSLTGPQEWSKLE
jgi:hypothetical protein